LGSYNTCNSSTFLASKTSRQQEYTDRTTTTH
jgi:hypothetical protein